LDAFLDDAQGAHKFAEDKYLTVLHNFPSFVPALVGYAVHMYGAKSHMWWQQHQVFFRAAKNASEPQKQLAVEFFQHVAECEPPVPDVLCILGHFYLTVVPSPAKAFCFFQEAARCGHSLGYIGLGVCYLKGLGVAQDGQKAADNFHKAAKLNHYVGMFYYGVCCFAGIGVDKSREEGVEWILKSANLEYPPAQNIFGHLPLLEHSKKHVLWIRMAAEKGYRCKCALCSETKSVSFHKGDIPTSIAEAVSKRCCTVEVTGDADIPQMVFECIQCGLKGKRLAICEVCKEACHKAHQLASQQAAVDCTSCACGLCGPQWCKLAKAASIESQEIPTEPKVKTSK